MTSEKGGSRMRVGSSNLRLAMGWALLGLASCGGEPEATEADPQQAWWDAMQALCGQARAEPV